MPDAGGTRATLVEVAGAGHFIPLERPEAFDAAVRRWLGLPSR